MNRRQLGEPDKLIESSSVRAIFLEMRMSLGIGCSSSNDPAAIFEVIFDIAGKSLSAHKEFFGNLEIAIYEDLQSSDSCIADHAASLLIECASYFDNTDSPERAINIALKAVQYSEKSGNKHLSRRANSYLGAVYTRVSDYNSACKHVKFAYILANEMGDPVGIFATLANTVAVLDSMRLLAPAKELSLKLTLNQPWEGESLSVIHLSNASNGLRLCHRLNDNASSEIFYLAGQRALTTCLSSAGDITRAHFEAASITYLARVGKICEADRAANAALNRHTANDNVRIRALLLCAQAFVHMQLGDIKKIISSSEKIHCLLEFTSKLPDHHEELLETLIELHTYLNAVEVQNSLDKVVSYLRVLKAYTFTVKHKQFFQDSYTKLMRREEQFTLESPCYIIPSWILKEKALATEQSEPNLGEKNTPFNVADIELTTCESGQRSIEYDVAENWAVAAEFACGGDGQHCFNVGKVAAAIARKLLYSEIEIVKLELACRLHDIGKAVTAFSQTNYEDRRTLGTFSLACEHTSNGAELLASSNDPVLRLASTIAKSHHEWWNGYGYPVGLSGTSIPVEGRICAIANVFVGLICSSYEKRRWTMKSAIHQIQSMAGMQLDPNLIIPLVQVATNCEDSMELLFDSGRLRLEENQLNRAKKELCTVLESAR